MYFQVAAGYLHLFSVQLVSLKAEGMANMIIHNYYTIIPLWSHTSKQEYIAVNSVFH